jgi:hypothetical protein
MALLEVLARNTESNMLGMAPNLRNDPSLAWSRYGSVVYNIAHLERGKTQGTTSP